MKTAIQSRFFTFNLLILVLAIISLSSCGTKQFHKEIKTPKMVIELNGNKPTSLDPFTVGIVVTHNESKKKVNLDMEIFANDLNDTNPVFSANANGKYTLVFSQTDNTTRALIFSMDDDEVVIEEVL